MRHLRGSSLILLMGLGVSLAGHAALGFGFSRWADELAYRSHPDPISRSAEREPPRPFREASQAAEDRNPPEKRELRLGIDDGSAETLTWLGFREATEHQARLGPTEQSEMTLHEGVPGRPSPTPLQPAQPSVTPEAGRVAEVQQEPPVSLPAELGASAESEAEPVEAVVEDSTELPPQVDEEALQREIAEELARRTSEAAERLTRSIEQILPTFSGAPKQRSERHQAEQVREQQHTQPRTPQAPPAPTDSQMQPGTGGMPGIPSDRESIATSIKQSPVVRPGRVLAAKGLEILTRRPRFTTTTRMTRVPRNPVVEVTFGRDGRVKRAAFVNDGQTVYGTGSEDVDQPLLNAVYSWTARGKPLEEIDAADPEAGVTIVITIILVG